MYRAFRLYSSDLKGLVEPYAKAGEGVVGKNDEIIRGSCDTYKTTLGIDGSFLRDQWFPEIESDVFIAHSHSDEQTAINFAGWLKRKFNINSFIDSRVWGYADDLLKSLDDNFCKNTKTGIYNYQKRNVTTSHVHMMLATALSKIINNTECVIFLDSPASVSLDPDLGSRICSPWIFYELQQISVLRNKSLGAHRQISTLESFAKAQEAGTIHYKPEFALLTRLLKQQLDSWDSEFNLLKNKKQYPLDLLYEIVPESRRLK